MTSFTTRDAGPANPFTRAVGRLLDDVVTRACVDPEDVVVEAAKRGLPVRGADASQQLASLRWCAPAALDPLARSFVASNALVAGLQGFVANLGGAVALPVALTTDTVGTLAAMVRATSGVMGAYGFETETQQGAVQLRLGLLIGLGVSRLTLQGTQVLVGHLSAQLLDRIAAEQLTAALSGHLSRRLGTDLVRRRLPRAVPVVGGAIGGGVNVAMVRAMGGRARAHYRRLLVDWQHNQGIRPIQVWDVG
ncbi:MAG: EcsC family protein [Actinomycetota bacterium]|nr:EcsC family protein [Actinomycetota bacterium]